MILIKSNKPIISKLMDLLNPITLFIQGVNINRDTVNNIRKSGFEVEVEKNLVLDILKLIEGKPDKS